MDVVIPKVILEHTVVAHIIIEIQGHLIVFLIILRQTTIMVPDQNDKIIEEKPRPFRTTQDFLQGKEAGVGTFLEVFLIQDAEMVDQDVPHAIGQVIIRVRMKITAAKEECRSLEHHPQTEEDG